MSKLIKYQAKEDNALEIVVDTSSGETFASISATARMCGVSKQAISSYCSVNQMEVKTSEILVTQGVAPVKQKKVKRKVKLLNEEQILDCLYEYNPKLTRAFAKLGLRKYHHQITGYTHKDKVALYPDRSEQYKDLYKELKELIRATNAKPYHYIQLNQALNRVVGKVEGRTNNTIDEIESLAYCKLMEKAISMGKTAMAAKYSESNTRKIITGQINKLEPDIKSIQASLRKM